MLQKRTAAILIFTSCNTASLQSFRSVARTDSNSAPAPVDSSDVPQNDDRRSFCPWAWVKATKDNTAPVCTDLVSAPAPEAPQLASILR